MASDEINIFQVVGYDDTNLTQPPEIMSVPDSFYPIIGMIVIKWATLEQEAEALISALLEFNAHPRAAWQKLPFNKRWSLLQSEFSLFAAQNDELKKEMKEVDRLVKSAKAIRDGISHQRIIMGMDQTGNFLRLEIDHKSYPWSKRYYEKDLWEASLNINRAGGRLYRLGNPDHPNVFSAPALTLIRRLRNMDDVRFPMPKPRDRPN